MPPACPTCSPIAPAGCSSIRAGRARVPRGVRWGIVRALDMYELFPFWRGVFESLGVEIVLSEGELSARALQTIPSESICYPAKLAHGHLAELFDRGVERVFMPYVASVVAGGSACPVTRGIRWF